MKYSFLPLDIRNMVVIAQYDGIPGFMNTNGNFAKMTSLSTHGWYRVDGVKLLYVDCKESFSSMHYHKLINISFDQSSIDKLKSSNKRVQHDTK